MIFSLFSFGVQNRRSLSLSLVCGLGDDVARENPNWGVESNLLESFPNRGEVAATCGPGVVAKNEVLKPDKRATEMNPRGASMLTTACGGLLWGGGEEGMKLMG